MITIVADASPVELVAHFEQTHHAYLIDPLPHIEALVLKATDVRGNTQFELHAVKASFVELRRDLEPHLETAALVLFRSVRRGTPASVS